MTGKNAPVCEARESACICNRATRHKIHRCDCGGSWTYDEAGEMQPRTWPGGYTNPWQAIYDSLDPLGGLFR